MQAKTLFNRASQHVKLSMRGESLIFVEVPMDSLAKITTFQWLGVKDPTEARDVVRELRSQFDKVSEHYLKYGRTYLPEIEVSMSPMMSWILVFIYLCMTRGGIHYMSIPKVLKQVMPDSAKVVRASRMLLDFTDDHRLWDLSEEHFANLLQDCGVEYRPVHRFRDGDDVLMIANLVGLHRGYNLNVNHIPIALEGEEAEDILAETFPPMVTALLDPEEVKVLGKAYFANIAGFENSSLQFMSVPMTDDRTIDIIEATLISHGRMLPSTGGRSSARASVVVAECAQDIADLVTFLRVIRSEPIPMMRDTELDKRIKKRFRFSIFPDQNKEANMVIFNICSVLALTLTPPNKVMGVH